MKWNDAFFIKAIRLMAKRRFAAAFAWFHQGAQAGNPHCMLNVGYLYDEGIGVKPDKHTAMFWYQKAWQRNEIAAATNIAILYKERKDYTNALQWLEKASASADDDAKLILARFYLQGLGVNKDATKTKTLLTAVKNSTTACEASVEEASYLLSQLK
jgi:TPR repeat protein